MIKHKNRTYKSPDECQLSNSWKPFKKALVIVWWLTGFHAAFGQAESARNWLSTEFTKGVDFNHIEAWRQQKRSETLGKIAALPDSIKSTLLKQGEQANSYVWPALPATLYLDYKFTGTRTNYEQLQGERRRKLAQLAIAELIEGKGRFIPQIVNGLWLVMEESTWVAPAHIVVQKAGSGLPDPAEGYIDLNAGRTAVSLAMIYDLLGPELDEYSKVINRRIVSELERRIFQPYMQYNHFWWMGFKGNSVNNWNAWVNTNCMQTALLVMKNPDTLHRFTEKILRSTDHFINQYPLDGGCDEGPSYWNEAGGKLIRMLSLLNSASKGQLDWKYKTLIHDMGSYIYKMQIADQYMVNFADATALSTPNFESVYQYGTFFDDPALKQFAAFQFKQNQYKIPSGDLTDFVAAVNIYAELMATKALAPYPAVSLFKDLQVLTMRSNAGNTKGMFVAIKGGNNAESHNHNDIGNFIIYMDGKPAIIDVGVGTYTSKTFSKQRYELWNLQSQWHNCPQINGQQQQDGKSFAAKDFLYSHKGDHESLQLDLAPAYPKAAMVNNWTRKLDFYPEKEVLTLTESYQLKAYHQPSALTFMTAEPVVESKGALTFGDSGLAMEYDPAQFQLKIETRVIDDDRLKKSWGEKVYRVQLMLKSKSLKDQLALRFYKKK
ncbi:heparinase II/III family protein [Pedobacter gandavensis]|uniref:heparinase II/III domain-containing protein n=1 Tax=Pedobacter gandavensis TaxID=2679963 RepID=UPI00292CDCCE|nr:heparinase II/III family protein [Pedobacter gandavensis]